MYAPEIGHKIGWQCVCFPRIELYSQVRMLYQTEVVPYERCYIAFSSTT